jgi:hypothetical protein
MKTKIIATFLTLIASHLAWAGGGTGFGSPIIVLSCTSVQFEQNVHGTRTQSATVYIPVHQSQNTHRINITDSSFNSATFQSKLHSQIHTELTAELSSHQLILKTSQSEQQKAALTISLRELVANHRIPAKLHVGGKIIDMACSGNLEQIRALLINN